MLRKYLPLSAPHHHFGGVLMKPRYWMPLGFLAALLLAVTLLALPGNPAAAQTPDSTGVITVPIDWELMPAGLNEGDEFRLIFMTSQKRDATSTDIADYDTFVQNSAGGVGAHEAIKPYASRFKVVGSTRALGARFHTGTNPNNTGHKNVPIYWLNGQRVAANNAGFWSSTWEHWAMADRRNEAGNQGDGDQHWSGTTPSGWPSAAGFALGEDTPTRGQFRVLEASMFPMSGGPTSPKAQHHSLYAISPVFKKAITPPTGVITVPVDWDLMPAGLEDGDEFRLIFMTSQKRNAQSENIADYDAFVQNAAGGSNAHTAIRPYASRFKAVGSTRSVSARDHTGTNPNNAGHKNVPIYWLNGDRVAANNTRFWSSTWENWTMSDRHTEAGSQGDNDWHWSGTDPAGTVPGASGLALGENTPRRGRFKASDTDTRPMSGGTNAPKAQQHSLYAISPVFKKDITLRVEIRVCPSGATCAEGSDAGWVVHGVDDGPPTIELTEGGADVSYQFRLRSPTWFRSVNVDVTHPGEPTMSSTHNAIRPGERDYDRLICRDGSREIGLTSYPADDPGTVGGAGQTIHLPQLGVDGGGNAVYSDQTGGCPHNPRSITWADRDAWQTVTVAAGHDADAFDHVTSLVHYTVATDAPYDLFQKTPHVKANSNDHDDRADEWPVRIKIVDDDEWEQNFLVKTGDTDWTSLSDGGLDHVLPDSMGQGDEHTFRMKLKNNPATLGVRTSAFQILSFDSLNANARVSSSVDSWPSRGKAVDWPADTHNGSWNGEITFTVHAADDAGGLISVKLTAQNLLRRVDNQLPVAGATHKTRSYTHNLTTTTCVGICPSSIISMYSPPDLPREWLVLQQQPEVSITAGGGVTEGGDATFTITASPAPGADLDVTVTVSASGDYGAPTGQQTVTIPTTGSATLTVGTTNDDADEADGSVTAMLDIPAPDAGYTVSGAQSAATVTVADDDDASSVYTVAPQVVANVKLWMAETYHGAEHVNRWQRVLVAFGALDAAGVSGSPMSAAEAQGYADLGWQRWVPVVAELTALEASQQDLVITPEVSVTAGGGVTEGGDATFTITASPAPAADLDVSVTVSASGDYGAATGQQTVTIPTTGSVTLTVSTTNDDADEADGSVTATLDTPAADAGYTVSATQGAATVTVADDDDAVGYTVAPQVVANVKLWVAETYHGAEHVNRWQRVLVAFGALDAAGVSGSPMSAAEAQGYADLGWQRWVPVVAELTALEASQQDLVITPEVSVTTGSGVTEGGDATFTVTASPAPAANLDVSVTVSQSGDYGAATGQQTVTIPTTGSATLTVGTTNDGADEADGSVTATLDTPAADAGYTVSATQGAATVSVADDDDPLLIPPPPTPEVSVSAGGGVTEGGDASFTVTASPAPAANLDVSVTVSQSGDYGATTGQRTVTIPTTGSATLTVGTTNDGADEADGSVTATVNTGSGYTVSATQGAATVSVADDDDPPPATPEVSVTAGNGVTEGGDATFTVTASPAPAANLDVSVTVSQSGDYGATTGQQTVTIPTTGSATLTVGTTDDGADEADGSVTATVNTGSGYTVSATQGAATVSVADDDDAPEPEVELSVTVEDASATEGGVVEFRILLSHALTEEFEVNWYAGPAYHVLDNRAHSGDYQTMSGVMVFKPGVTALTGEVWLNDDSEEEPDEYFAVEAFLPGEWFKPASVGTMTIVDDD